VRREGAVFTRKLDMVGLMIKKNSTTGKKSGAARLKKRAETGIDHRPTAKEKFRSATVGGGQQMV